jgi:hypothetical protein
MSVSRLAVVADKLESTNHLANGEEAKAFSSDNTTSNELSP